MNCRTIVIPPESKSSRRQRIDGKHSTGQNSEF
jgi:hypothetical protein